MRRKLFLEQAMQRSGLAAGVRRLFRGVKTPEEWRFTPLMRNRPMRAGTR